MDIRWGERLDYRQQKRERLARSDIEVDEKDR